MKHLLAAAVLMSALLVSAYAQNSVTVGSVAPTFSAVALDGTDYDLADLRGKVVVITFWSTQCEICRAEFPHLNKLIQSYEGKDAVFLAVTMNDNNRVRGFLKQNPLRAAVLADNFGVVMQYADRDAKGFVNMAFPSFFVVDKQGIVKHRSSGFGRIGQMDSILGNLGAK